MNVLLLFYVTESAFKTYVRACFVASLNVLVNAILFRVKNNRIVVYR